ncbi:hypothetical protein, conserved [Plasmodium gonderi]|uniref:VPS9 domain-containing protein n=1 Tax=Plasmodium gonderi TaxID=77519 RepID=A0A1Y1JF69_PLAGO|nr:hypothetical protein, conserved [Plasmodium gonderi]GAW81156.1 hypothetical protein, conserved [Plasmodium gonderi]
MEPVKVHPVLSILVSKYKYFHENLSNKTHVLLLPEAKTLLNINIDIDFMKKHICCKSHLKNVYINLLGQSIEIDAKYVCTGYGFQESRICKIVKIETNANYRLLKIISINIPLEGGYQEGAEPVSYIHDAELDVQFNDLSDGELNVLNDKNKLFIFFNKNVNCHEFLHNQLLQFTRSHIIVKGFENCIGKKIISIVKDTMKLQNNTDENILKNDIKMPLVKHVYSCLYSIIWKQLVMNYEKIENKTQEKMINLKQDIKGFLKKINLGNISLFHVETVSFYVKQIEKCTNPIDKIHILDNTSKIICEIITCTNQDLKKQNLAIYDINSDSLIAILVAAISYGEVKNIISHSIHLHMYIDNLKSSEKIDKLSFVFTIFHSSIIYLCDMKEM